MTGMLVAAMMEKQTIDFDAIENGLRMAVHQIGCRRSKRCSRPLRSVLPPVRYSAPAGIPCQRRACAASSF